MNSRFAIRWLVTFVAILILTSTASAEWKEKVLYSFQGGTDGAYPAGGVVFDKQGNLYGATQQGGADNCSPMAACGTVYQLSPPGHKGGAWTETILHVFKGKAFNDGEFPAGGVIADASGSIYGTTSYGGTGDCVLLGIKGGCGTVYEFSPPGTEGGAWTYAILYSFKGGNDGYLPNGDLVFDSTGSLYGSTAFGGGKGTTCDPGYYQYCGTVFKLSPPKTKGGKWTEQVLHSFAGSPDGGEPNGGLVIDKTGAIYGMTHFGGNDVGDCHGGVGGTGCGIAFELKPPVQKGPWVEEQIQRFDVQDGVNPTAGLVFSAGGDLYGTTYGGPTNGYGLIFELRKPSGKIRSWAEAVLWRFTDQNDGGYPLAGLIFDPRGNLYGTVSGGGTFRGDVFRLSPPEKKGGDWTLGVLYGFTGSPDGGHPAASLIFDKTGNLYSTTESGGTSQLCQGGCGTVFEVLP
jgi:hypothetical protein